MNDKNFNRLIKKIAATEEEEISCSVCFDLVSDYVDAELSGKEIKGVYRQVQQHLDQCLACRDEYEMLRDFVKNDSKFEDSRSLIGG